jgi:hypothetical protein
VNRRAFVKTGVLAAAAFVLCGHTPYGQWVVYRKKHLLIGCHKADPPTYDLALATVAILQEHLPEASARVARAPDARRLASLLSTDQLETGILSGTDASSMAAGTDGFEPYGPVPLRLIAPLEHRLLVAHQGFPDRHAWLVSAALFGTVVAGEPDLAQTHPIQWHPGSLAFATGKPEPRTSGD